MLSRIVLATRNFDKAREMREILHLSGAEFPILPDLDDHFEVDETGDTLAENAILKARGVYDRFGLPALADDTGLEVDFLDGAPGVFSSRFAGEKATYGDNVAKLLREMAGAPPAERMARFRCVMALVCDEGVHLEEGVTGGRILDEPRGEGGFGYDPVFLVEGHDLTYSEMDAAMKNSVSHRGMALRRMTDFLVRLKTHEGQLSDMFDPLDGTQKPTAGCF